MMCPFFGIPDEPLITDVLHKQEVIRELNRRCTCMEGAEIYALCSVLGGGQGLLMCVQAMCGLVKPVFRLPYVPLSYEQRVQGAKLLRAVAEHIHGAMDIRVLNDEDFILIGRH
jgi:hypothetical protein